MCRSVVDANFFSNRVSRYVTRVPPSGAQTYRRYMRTSLFFGVKLSPSRFQRTTLLVRIRDCLGFSFHVATTRIVYTSHFNYVKGSSAFVIHLFPYCVFLPFFSLQKRQDLRLKLTTPEASQRTNLPRLLDDNIIPPVFPPHATCVPARAWRNASACSARAVRKLLFLTHEGRLLSQAGRGRGRPTGHSDN